MSHPGHNPYTQPYYTLPPQVPVPDPQNQYYGQPPPASHQDLDAPAHLYPFYNLDQPVNYRTQPQPQDHSQLPGQIAQPYTGGSLDQPGEAYYGEAQHPYHPGHTGQYQAQAQYQDPYQNQHLQPQPYFHQQPQPTYPPQSSHSPNPLPSPIQSGSRDGYIDPNHLSTAPPTAPSAREPSVDAKANPLRIKLQINTQGPGTSMSRRASNGNDSYGGRPVRQARAKPKTSYIDRDSGEDDFEDDGYDEEMERAPRPSRNRKPPKKHHEDDFEDRLLPSSPVNSVPTTRRSGRSSRSHPDEGYGEEVDVEDEIVPNRRRAFPPRPAANEAPTVANLFDDDDNGPPPPIDTQDTETDATPMRARRKGKSRQSSEGSFAPDQSDEQSEQSESDDPLAQNLIHDDRDDDESDALYSDDAAPRRTRQTRQSRRPATRTSNRTRSRRQDAESDDYGGVPVKKRLRERKSAVNYALPPADLSAEILQDAIASASRPGGGPGRSGVGRAGGVRFGAAAGKALPWSARGRDLAHAMGDPDTSDSDDFAAPLKGGGPSAVAAGGAGGAGRGGAPTDVVNFGRINPKSSTADADPLGVDMNVTFDNVGGLDNHINQLKEMVALPLLYPELFQQFGITPPRGVLFHGPPGTGKTLLARALAASCSTGNTKIAFFMRKGADVLSKWVGEAERQLRMLFEEARAAQPSIIFFDEIDGLAPVRSSKQDQIHASLVSTLLALMDGMDGRGQVIVIGATNRPDSVDPALRRPGRFDREFYFPLPNREARKKIIGINTRKWDPKLEEPVLDQLAGLTKGYGGADLRALCTEAALNAIQRRYPQIYKTSDRLLLQPESIQVQAKDFMMSVKKIVPSSARSSSSAAAPLPPHLLPLLSSSLERLKKVVDHALPSKRNVTALEEAEFEEEQGDSFAKHSMLQSLDKMRTYRPRILVHGQPGMGQAWLGPAILHHLEGFHVQSLDLGTLMGDSTRTVEAGLVQLFVEAKRHQPSVIFIPSLSQWASAISDTARSTIRALLDGVPASDPILILALVDGELRDLPRDIRSWFGLGKENRVALDTPSSGERSTYFAEIINTISMPPTDFPDAVPRRKRVLEVLPPAPPLPPREKTEAEIAKEHEKDVQAREMMIISFTGLIQDFMRKFRKVTATVRDDAMELSAVLQSQTATEEVVEAQPAPNGLDDPTSMIQDPPAPEETNGEPTPAAAAPAAPTWQAHNLDIDIISIKLSRHKYLTPSDFLADIAKIEENANKLGDPDRITKIGEMGAHARMHVLQFDPAWEPRFEAYAQRVRVRKAKKQAEKKRLENGGVEQVEGQAEGVNGIEESGENGETSGSSLKRPRESVGASETNGDERGEKRPREDIIMEDSAVVPDIAPPEIAPAEVVEATIPPPCPTYPPFVVDTATLSSLSTTLVHTTASFSVEQLEQLRAACFDTVWRHRADWDRAVCMREVRKVVEDLVVEVREMQEEDESL